MNTPVYPLALPPASPPPEPDRLLCELPRFVQVPAVPGLPTDVTGAALRATLRERADAVVASTRG
jgi:hypothetical protein